MGKMAALAVRTLWGAWDAKLQRCIAAEGLKGNPKGLGQDDALRESSDGSLHQEQDVRKDWIIFDAGYAGTGWKGTLRIEHSGRFLILGDQTEKKGDWWVGGNDNDCITLKGEKDGEFFLRTKDGGLTFVSDNGF